MKQEHNNLIRIALFFDNIKGFVYEDSRGPIRYWFLMHFQQMHMLFRCSIKKDQSIDQSNCRK